MSTIKRLLVLVTLATVFLALIVVGYLAYNKLISKTEILKSDLENKSWALEAAKGELSKANQKNISFVAEKEGVNKKIAAQKERITEIFQAKEKLQKQQEALSLDKQELEKALEKAEHLYREQVNLRKLEVKAKEKSFKRRVREKWLDFFAEKKALEKQIKKVKAELEESAQTNRELLTKLGESSQMIVKLKLEKGEENNQLDLMSQEDEQFREEALKFHYNRAFVYDQNAQYEKALVEYKKALEAVSDDADVHYNLAILYDEYLLDKRKAIEHYHAYLKFCSDVQDAVKVNYWIREAEKELEWKDE